MRHQGARRSGQQDRAQGGQVEKAAAALDGAAQFGLGVLHGQQTGAARQLGIDAPLQRGDGARFAGGQQPVLDPAGGTEQFGAFNPGGREHHPRCQAEQIAAAVGFSFDQPGDAKKGGADLDARAEFGVESAEQPGFDPGLVFSGLPGRRRDPAGAVSQQ